MARIYRITPAGTLGEYWYIGGVGDEPLGPYPTKTDAELQLDHLRAKAADGLEVIREQLEAKGRL